MTRLEEIVDIHKKAAQESLKNDMTSIQRIFDAVDPNKIREEKAIDFDGILPHFEPEGVKDIVLYDSTSPVNKIDGYSSLIAEAQWIECEEDKASYPFYRAGIPDNLDQNRLRILYFNESCLIDIFRLDGTKILKMRGLPDDAQIVNVDNNIRIGFIAFKIWSKSFDIIRKGEYVPELQLFMEQEYKDTEEDNGKIPDPTKSAPINFREFL